MRALDLVRHRLAEVVEERRPFRGLRRRLDLRRHHPCELHDFERVLEHVLAVARAVAEPAEDLHELLVEIAAVRLEDSLLAGLPDVLVELGLREVVHLLDPRRMDPAVLDQLQQRHACDLAADAVEGREDDGVRGVVDDEVDAGEVLERPDVASFPPDDAALHVVGGQLDERHSGLGRRARSDALERVRDEVAGAPLRFGRRLFLHLANAAGELVPYELFGLGEDPLLRLAGGHARDALELLPLVVLDLLDVLLELPEVHLAICDALFTTGELAQLPVDVVFLRDGALFDLQYLVAALAQLRFEVRAELHGLLAGLDRGLAAGRLGLATGLVEDERARTASRFQA